MRTVSDRVRHALLFEIIGICLSMPIGYFLFGLPILKMGVIGAFSSVIATLWNYLYNLFFDHAMLFFRKTVRKTVSIRILHALLFELGLIIILLPAIAYYLNISLWEAFQFDIVLVVFYLIYAFVFNWLYDRIFPIPNI